MVKDHLARGGRAAAKARTATPEAARKYLLRTEIGKGLAWLKKNSPDGYQRILAEIRPLVVAYPEHFHGWDKA